MTKTQINPELTFAKSRELVFFEYILLAVCLCVIAIRGVAIEGPIVQLANQPINMGDSTFSLVVSAILIFGFLFWLIFNLLGERFFYRFTTLEIGLTLFIVAAVIASAAASNKRAAITNSVALLAPIIMAVLLVQLMDSYSKVKLLLYTIVVLGVLSAGYSLLQLLWTNQMLLSQYQADPNTILQKLGIIPGSFQQMLFEHSLHSNDIRGFFTTGNSAGSFTILASFTAVALLIENFKSPKQTPRRDTKVLLFAVASSFTIFGILITHSKGAIIAAVFGAILLLIYLGAAKWLYAHRKSILVFSLLSIIAAGFFTVWFILTHNRLPGGNSMLVRWQYWFASAKMYADHPLTGVGPGNFAYFYSHYKAPEALETVSDPHNFLLSFLLQYGPLGLVGFLITIFAPLAAIVFTSAQGDKQDDQVSQSYNPTIAALFCGVLALLLHNTIDFAIFECAILTTFWAIIACLITLHFLAVPRPLLNLKAPVFAKISLTIVSLALIWACLNYALIPPALAAADIKFAKRRTQYPHEYLAKASKEDSLDPVPANLNARLYLTQFTQTGKKQPTLLIQAAESFLTSASRNKADFKNYESLIELYNLLAESSVQPGKDHWLDKAFDSAQIAVSLYPGSDRLNLELAKIAEKLNKNDIALRHYKKAVEIEDAYRLQFQAMYPGQKIFSRLGEDAYQLAKQKINLLSPK